LVGSGFKKNASYNQLKGVLTGADLVKFAKYNPEAAEHESIFQESWAFVLATREDSSTEEKAEIKNSGEEKI
jgi:hypothetical protein